jgi:hypothetical protein
VGEKVDALDMLDVTMCFAACQRQIGPSKIKMIFLLVVAPSKLKVRPCSLYDCVVNGELGDILVHHVPQINRYLNFFQG